MLETLDYTIRIGSTPTFLLLLTLVKVTFFEFSIEFLSETKTERRQIDVELQITNLLLNKKITMI